jgi:hypothetical protein
MRFQTAMTALLILFAGVGECLAGTYSNSQGHFTINIPEGWQDTTGEDGAMMSSAASMLPGTPMSIVVVYRGGPETPVLTIAVTNTRITLGQVDDNLAAIRKSVQANVDRVSGSAGLPAPTVVVDRDYDRVVVSGVIPDPKGYSNIVGYIYPGSNGTVTLYFFDQTDSVTTPRQPEFQQIADSFSYDSGYGPSANYWIWGLSFTTIVIGIIIGVILLNRKKKAAQARYRSYSSSSSNEAIIPGLSADDPDKWNFRP